MVISRENVIMCCLVRAIDGYGAMVEWLLAGRLIMCCLVRAIDGYRAMVEW